jgi:hypothetical protein
MRQHVIVVGVTLLIHAALAASAPAQKLDLPERELPALLKMSPVKADPKDDALRKLLKERYNEAIGELQENYERVRAGALASDVLDESARRALHAGLELNENSADQLALLEKYVAFTKEVEMLMEVRLKTGLRATSADVHRAKYFRADAEIQLLRAKEKAKGGKK